MDFTLFFNPNFVSSNAYIKVAGVLRRGGAYDIFSVTENKSTKHVEIQRFINRGFKEFRNNVFGRAENSNAYFFDEASNAPEYADFKRLYCNNIFRSFNRFLQLTANIPEYDETEKKKIRDMLSEVFDRFNNGASPVPAPAVESAVNEGWNIVDINTIPESVIPELVNAISENNGRETVYDGKVYRFNVVDGKNVLQVKVAETVPVAEMPEVKAAGKIRKFIQMAKVVNAENLNCIVNGNFYPILDEKTVRDVKYLTIKVGNDDYTLRKSRFKVVNVFTETPV